MSDHKELVDRLEYVVEQLRLRAKFLYEYATPFDPDLDNEAARVIEEQAAEIARLKDGLERIRHETIIRPSVRQDVYEIATAALTHPPETN